MKRFVLAIRLIRFIGISRGLIWVVARVRNDGVNSTFSNLRRRMLGQQVFLPHISVLGQIDSNQFSKLEKSTLIVFSSFAPQQCIEYRVQQRLDAYGLLGENAQAQTIENIDTVLLHIISANINRIILFRLEYDERVSKIISLAKKFGIPIGFECDDLMFDVNAVKNNGNFAFLPKALQVSLIRHAAELEMTIQKVDFLIASTSPLAFEMSHFRKDVYLIPNAISERMINLSNSARELERLSPNNLNCSMYYGSASLANSADFALAATSLRKVLNESERRILLFGSKPNFLTSANTRVENFVNFRFYLRTVASIPISIAPLANSRFNDCKSPIKAYEALILGQDFLSNHALYFKDKLNNSLNVTDWEYQLRDKITFDQDCYPPNKIFEIPADIQLKTVTEKFVKFLPEGRK